MQKIFLGWEQSFLKAVLEQITAKFLISNSLNLHNIIFISSSRRLNRALLSEIVTFCEKNKIKLHGPDFKTLAELPESLLSLSDRPAQAEADQNEQLLAWIEALKQADPDFLSQAFAYDQELNSQIVLARRLLNLNTELSRNALSFDSLPDLLKESISEYELQRWLCLKEIYQNYLLVLKQRGLVDQELQAWENIELASKINSKTLILLNLIDLSTRLKVFFSKVESQVIHYIYAPISEEAGFDHQAALVYEHWLNKNLPINNSQIEVLPKAIDQGPKVRDGLIQFSTSSPATCISYADENTARVLELALSEAGIKYLSASGQSLGASALAKFFRVLVAHLKAKNFDTFKDLISNSNFFLLFKQAGYTQSFKECLNLIDQYQIKHYQQVFWKALLGADRELNKLVNQVTLLLEPFDCEAPIISWLTPIDTIIKSAFGTEQIKALNLDYQVLNESLKAVSKFLLSLRNLNESFPDFNCKATLVFDLILSELEKQQFYSEIEESNIKILGQLEVLLDPSENLIICDANEGLVPEVLTSDWLLPDGARKALGLLNNEQRLGREKYFQSALCQSKKFIRYFVPKIASDGKLRLAPSRILYACENEILPERVKHLYESPITEKSLIIETNKNPLFKMPIPSVNDGQASISITGFKQYLECPYRYYLKSVLGLFDQEYDLIELSARDYGNLIHKILNDFAYSEFANNESQLIIYAFLEKQLNYIWNQLYGDNALPALLLQKYFISQRLKVFSEWQSQWRKSGWLIEKSEYDISASNILIEHNEGTTQLRGRIDRIDRNQQTGALTIIDYKTSDSAIIPERAHRKSGEWIDLQLPLYHYVMRCLGEVADIQLAYCAISGLRTSNLLLTAKWSESDLDSALATARIVAESVAKAKFWPPNPEYPRNDLFQFMLNHATSYAGGEQ